MKKVPQGLMIKTGKVVADSSRKEQIRSKNTIIMNIKNNRTRNEV